MIRACANSARVPMVNKFTSRLFFIGAWAVFGLAQGAEPAKAGSFGKGKAGGPLLSRAELRDCMARQDQVRGLGTETVAMQAALDQEKAAIAALGAGLKEKMAALDRTNAEAVDAYNLQALDFDKRVDGYNSRTPAFNAKADALKNERDAFAKACENRRFDEKDEIAIKSGKP